MVLVKLNYYYNYYLLPYYYFFQYVYSYNSFFSKDGTELNYGKLIYLRDRRSQRHRRVRWVLVQRRTYLPPVTSCSAAPWRTSREVSTWTGPPSPSLSHSTCVIISKRNILSLKDKGFPSPNNNNKKLVCATKCRCKLSSARLSATVRLGTKQMCLQHTLETQQKDWAIM